MIRHIEATKLGIHTYEMDLDILFETEREHDSFNHKWVRYEEALGPDLCTVERVGNRIRYQTEQFTPALESRLLLLLGNPANQSVRAGVCFANEKSQASDHRFWRALEQASVLTFNELSQGSQRNVDRATALMDGNYLSTFLIGIDVMFTFPTPASNAWAGVAGIEKLFGARAFRRIWETERVRIQKTIGEFSGDNGIVLTFQKHAFDGVRSAESPQYSLVGSHAGELKGFTTQGIRLVGMLPTRFAHSNEFKMKLKSVCQAVT
jgi:hypothetical protein